MKERTHGLWARLGTILSLRGLLLVCIGIGMMIYGISRGEMNVVWEKAVRICMECIGIG